MSDILDTIFREARTFTAWQEKPVADALLKEIYELAKMAPTAMNCQPLRVVYVKSPDAKEKLKPCLDKGNVDKTMSAPVTAIIGMDFAFYEHLPTLFQHAAGMRDAMAQKTDEQHFPMVMRNASLQGGYFILAARALGLDCGPMSGFNNAMVDEAFFAGTKIKSNFLCNLGYGDASKLHPRNPRLSFDEACAIL